MRYNRLQFEASGSGVMQARWQREYPPFLPIEEKPLPATLLQSVPRAEPRAEAERPSRLVWVALGTILLFGLVGGGGYWLSQRGHTPNAAAVTPPPAKPAAAAAPQAAPRTAPGEPHLAVGIPALSRPAPPPPEPPPAAPAQASAPVPDQPPPQLASGLRPVTPPPQQQTAEAPIPAQPRPAPLPRPRLQPRPAVQRAPPSDNPNSSGFVKF